MPLRSYPKLSLHLWRMERVSDVPISRYCERKKNFPPMSKENSLYKTKVWHNAKDVSTSTKFSQSRRRRKKTADTVR